MRFAAAAAAGIAATPIWQQVAAASSLQPPVAEHLFSNPTDAANWPKIPSIHESTLQARRILYLQGIATLSTVFPPSTSSSGEDAHTLEQRPADVGSAPIGLMEYVASCPPSHTDPTLIGVTLATSMKNAAAGSNVTLSMRYLLPADAPQPPPDPWAYYTANLPRFALVGYLQRMSDSVVAAHNISGCFFRTHPESRIWAPGSDIHDSWWGRLMVQEVYFFGGFGDRARIAWLPLDEWRDIEMEEVRSYRLVGEKDYDPKQTMWREWQARQMREKGRVQAQLSVVDNEEL